MSRRAAFLVCAFLSCIILSETAARCTGERQRDGQFYFNMTYALKKDVRDCETQWVINGSVAGIVSSDGITKYIDPLLNATASTAILKTCHEKLECLLICPSANINKKELCSCDITSTALPKVNMTSTTLPEVGLTDWSTAIWIGGCVLLILIIVTLYIKCSVRARCCPCAAEEVV